MKHVNQSVICIVTLLSTTLMAEVPPLISYQGRLTDSGNNPAADGSYEITFSIYDVETDGTPFWTETHNSILVQDGLFNAILGATTPFGPSQNKNATSSKSLGIKSAAPSMWLGVQVGSDPELTPRSRLLSVLFAFNADRADTAQFSYNSQSTIYSDTAFYTHGASVIEQAKNYMIAGDTSGVAFYIDSIENSIENIQTYHDDIKTVVISTYQSAIKTIPNDDSLIENYQFVINESFWRQYQSLFALSFYLLDPNNVTLQATAIAIIDSAIISTENSIVTANSLRQMIFLSASKPALKIDLSDHSNTPNSGDTAIVDIVVTNIGGGEAQNNYITISLEPDLILLTEDTVTIPNLLPGDSAVTSMMIYFDDLLHPQISNYMATAIITPNSTTAMSRSKATTYFVNTTYCCVPPTRGNTDGDVLDAVDISDIVYLVDFIFTNGETPLCADEANVDGNPGEDIDISDLVWLVDFIFTGGPPPANCP